MPPSRRQRPTPVHGAAFIVALVLVMIACRPASTGGREQANVPGYRTVRDVRLPGATSRWDYQVYDPGSRRLYISHLGASQIVVFDTAEQKVVGIVGDIPEVHGLALARDLGRLFASATGQNRLVAIDLNTLKVAGSAPTGSYPDGVAYAPEAGAVFVSNEHGSGDTVVDARTTTRLGDVELGGDIGNSQYDPVRSLVYVTVGSTNELIVLHPADRAIVGRYHLDGCEGAHGLQVDLATHRRLFVACEGNASLVAFDLMTQRTTQTFEVGDSPDVLAEDAANQRLYVAAESGQLAVFDTGGDSLKKLGQGNAGPAAHSVAVDPMSHLVYLPLTDVGGHPVLRELEPRP